MRLPTGLVIALGLASCATPVTQEGTLAELDQAEPDQVVTVLRVVLPPLHRAVTGPVESLRQHCQEVLDLIKSRVDADMFSEVYMEIQMSLAKQKGERSQSKKQNLIKNPEAAAKRKIRLNESKKKAKKAKYNK